MLYGRDRERSRIRELLAGAHASRSGALVIRGEAGVGKSALLADAHEQAADMQVLGGVGVESEAQLPFAALHQLVRPILGHVRSLPGPQSAALRGALGLAAGGRDDRFLVSLATLSLLADAAEERPLVCLVDDAHWLDDASADALLFVARRLEAEGVVMLFAARDGEVRRFEAPGLPELRIGGLDAEAARALIDRASPGVHLPDARDRLVAETGGNALALLELSSTLSDDQLVGGAAVLGPLPISARVERAFLARVRRLPDETQTLLLVAAADDSGELATVLRAGAELEVAVGALDDAEQTGLVRVSGPSFEFRHPLVRSAVYQGAPLSRRQAAHAALAAVLTGEPDADRRAWHRAAASLEPDPAVVAELEDAAERAHRRSGFSAASLALERAASLTIDKGQQVRQLGTAAENAWLGGRFERAVVLLERARPLAGDAIERAEIDRYRGLVDLSRARPLDAYETLLPAARDVGPVDAERALTLLNLAGTAAGYMGDWERQVAVADAARDIEIEQTPFALMLVQLLTGIAEVASGDFASAVPKLRDALERTEALDHDAVAAESLGLHFAGRVALYLGDDRAAYRIHREAAVAARTHGVLGTLSQSLPILTLSEIWAGQWDAAAANGQEGLRLAQDGGQEHLVAQARALLAVIAALRGEEDECRSLVAEARGLGVAQELAVVAEVATWALTLMELGLGRADDAVRSARHISRTMAVFWSALDRIEAAVRTGDLTGATAWLAAFESWAESTGAPWAQAVALHCTALLHESENDNEANRLFVAALEAHSHAKRPFERARTELAFGEFLRRARRRVAAREHLRSALDGFEALGATLWAERARVELRASGETARKREPSMTDALTAQELQVARFVADGHSNREVAAQLFLSPRTIDFHLRNVFRKLGITSRTQLARIELEPADESLAVAKDPAISPVPTERPRT